MAGGLFAVNRDFFFDLGAYDPGMKIWGAENLEMSFRVNFSCFTIFILQLIDIFPIDLLLNKTTILKMFKRLYSHIY